MDDVGARAELAVVVGVSSIRRLSTFGALMGNSRIPYLAATA
jgi:hypothetical protein